MAGPPRRHRPAPRGRTCGRPPPHRPPPPAPRRPPHPAPEAPPGPAPPHPPPYRLTVRAADGEGGADTPQVEFSVPLPSAGATLVALSADRAAVALPGPPRLELLDGAGQQVGLVPLDVPDADLATDAPGRIATTE